MEVALSHCLKTQRSVAVVHLFLFFFHLLEDFDLAEFIDMSAVHLQTHI